MEKIFAKIVGWVLVVAGIYLIGWSLYSAYGIFNGTKNVPRIFKYEDKPVIECPQVSGSKISTEQLQEQIQKIIEGQMKEQITKVIPPEFIEKILNLGSWAVFTGILLFAGGQIAGIGTKLVRV